MRTLFPCLFFFFLCPLFSVEPVAGIHTTHPGAFHSLSSLSLEGDEIELEDGSVWSVAPPDCHLVKKWMRSDQVVLTPHRPWYFYSSYAYQILNVTTGANVKVRLRRKPLYDGMYTHWITSIDYAERELTLEDESKWKVHQIDGGVLDHWLVNDTVIIGVNVGWFAPSDPNLLINVSGESTSDVIGQCETAGR